MSSTLLLQMLITLRFLFSILEIRMLYKKNYDMQELSLQPRGPLSLVSPLSKRCLHRSSPTIRSNSKLHRHHHQPEDDTPETFTLIDRLPLPPVQITY